MPRGCGGSRKYIPSAPHLESTPCAVRTNCSVLSCPLCLPIFLDIQQDQAWSSHEGRWRAQAAHMPAELLPHSCCYVDLCTRALSVSADTYGSLYLHMLHISVWAPMLGAGVIFWSLSTQCQVG